MTKIYDQYGQDATKDPDSLKQKDYISNKGPWYTFWEGKH